MLMAATVAAAQGAGLDERVANTTLLINGLPAEVGAGYRVEPMLPRLRFTEATFAAVVPDGTRDLVVVERAGMVWRVPTDQEDPAPEEKRAFLDLTGQVELATIEQGVLSSAFSPNFAQDRHIYINYTRSPKRLIMSRFRVGGRFDQIALGEEEVLLDITQPFTEHNGGQIVFGPDGMLYLSIGDGGSWGDPLNNAQNTRTLQGSILRLDVLGPPDAGLTYAIPADNPLSGEDPLTRREIFAYGLRNPFRLAIDPVTGLMFEGDVGQGAFEEVNLIRPGGNYGWPYREGNACYRPTIDCPTEGLTAPLVTYGRNVGVSVTVGSVYRGAGIPYLQGALLYSDFVTGHLWSLKYEDGRVAGPALLATTGLNIACIAPDADGEMILVNLSWGDSPLYRLHPPEPLPAFVELQAKITRLLDPPADLLVDKSGNAPAGAKDANSDNALDAADLVSQASTVEAELGFPMRVSNLPALEAAARGIDQSNAGIYPYQPVSPLWSDGTHKERFLALPGMEKMGYRHEGGFDMPNGAILVKNFLMPLDARDPEGSLQRIESRIMLRFDDRWHGFSYRWDEQETDAVLVGAEGEDRSFVLTDAEGRTSSYVWHYPSRTECFQCHTPAENFVLGVTAPQLDSEMLYPSTGRRANQLATYESLGLLRDPLPPVAQRLAPMVDPANTAHSLQDRARSYMVSNCSMCHQPGGPTPAMLDFRWSRNNGAMHAIGATPSAGDLGVAGVLIIHAGNDLTSLVPARMGRRGVGQMPPLASTVADHAAVEMMRDWIIALGDVSSDPVVVFGNLHTAQWASRGSAVDWLQSSLPRTAGGLGLFQPFTGAETFSAWEPVLDLQPLPAGRWRIEADVEWSAAQNWEYFPEVRFFARDTTGTLLGSVAYLDRVTPGSEPPTPLPRPGRLGFVFDSDGTTPWRLAFEASSVGAHRNGGPRIADLRVAVVANGEPVALQAPLLLQPAPFSQLANSTVALTWSQPLGQTVDEFRIWRQLTAAESGAVEHGEVPESIVGSTANSEFEITGLAPDTVHHFRVEAVAGTQSAVSATLTLRTGP